jgi:hypothetical protein
MSWDTASVDPGSAEASRDEQLGRAGLLLWAGAFAVATAAVGGWLWHVQPRAAPSLGNELPPAAFKQVQTAGTSVSRWAFPGTLPSSWAVEQQDVQVASAPDGGITVRTTPDKAGYQLIGPRTLLRAGDYVATVRGQVVTGGMRLGILDVERNRWVVTNGAFHLQQGVLDVGFRLDGPLVVEPILANAVTQNRSSVWTLRRVSIARAP